jgi:hypothetical protein
LAPPEINSESTSGGTMNSIRITISKRIENILKEKSNVASRLGDLRLFKRVSAIFAIGHGLQN